MVVLSTEYSSWVASALLIFATIVKLYPFFGISILLKERKSRFIALSLACFGVLVAYMIAASRSVAASWNLTMRGEEISYGANVLFFRYSQFFSEAAGIPQTSPLLRFGPMLLAFFLIGIAGMNGMVNRDPLTSHSPRNLAAFRMGASIYIGTFFLGNNWDYRLAFLILCMPQLLQWAKQATHGMHKGMARIALVMTYASCWHLLVWFAPSLENVRDVLFVMDEIFNWILFAGFGYLMSASLPEWMREQLSFITRTRGAIQAQGH